jgi:hypothetical protein
LGIAQLQCGAQALVEKENGLIIRHLQFGGGRPSYIHHEGKS